MRQVIEAHSINLICSNTYQRNEKNHAYNIVWRNIVQEAEYYFLAFNT